MSRRILLIRAVNVGGTAKLPMAELRSLAAELGAAEVTTYIASGNLICAPPGDAETFDRALEAAIEERFGFFREVISRSREQMQEALAAHPFDVADPKRSYITFLTEAPDAASIRRAEEYETRDDEWRVVGRELHIRYTDGAGSPQMNGVAIGRALAVPGTARNLITVGKLLDLTG